MAESDIKGLNTDVGTLKTDVSNVKTALSSKQDTITGAASTIVEDNLTAGKVLVSNASGKVSAASVGIDDINPVGKYLKLTGGTLTGLLVLEDEEAQIKIGEAGVIFNPSHNEPQIVVSDSNYATQYISLSSSQTKIVGGTQFTNTNMTLASGGITIQKLESGVPSTATLSGISDGVNANDAVNLSQLNAVKAEIPDPSSFLPVTGGTLLGDLNLNLNALYLDGGGYRINAPVGRLQIKQATDLTPNSVAIVEYNDDDNKQLHIVVNDSSDGSHNTQVVLKKNTLQLYNNTVSGSSTSTGYVNVKGVADGTDTHDAVNLGQLNKLAPKGVADITFGNIVLSSAIEVLHNILFDCTYTGVIYSSTVIGGGASIPVDNTSYIVSVGGSDFGDSYGPCAVQKNKDSWNVTIRMLCTSRDAPNSITVPCLVW